MGEVGGVGGHLRQRYGLRINYMHSVTIAVSDAEGEREGPENDLEVSDWGHIDNYETPRHQMRLRTRRMGEGGYREVVPKLEDWGSGKGHHFAILGIPDISHDAMNFDFKFDRNRTAGSEDTILFVAAHGPRSHHPTSGRIRLPCLIR